MEDRAVLRLSKHAKVGLLGAIVSIIALYFIVTQVNFELFGRALLTANYIYLLPTIALLMAGLVARAIRWRILLNHQLPLARSFSIMNVAYLVNGVLPLRIGEVARVYLVSRLKKPVPIPQTTSTIIVERLLDLLSVVVMVLLALTVGPVPEEIQAASAAFAIMAVAGFLLLITVASKRRWMQRLLALIMQYLVFLKRFPLEMWLDQFLDGLSPLMRPRVLSAALGWTVVSWIFSIAAGYVLMFAFFEQGSLAATLLYIAAAAFAIALPAVPGNIGTYETSILLALGAMGYEQSSTALAFAVMVHAVNVFVHASTGVAGFVQEGISLNQLSHGVQQMQQPTEAG